MTKLLLFFICCRSFIPLFLGATTPTSSFEWSGSATSCFQTNSAQLTQIAGTDRYNLTLTASGPRTPGCSDFYLFGTVDGLALQTVSSAGSTTIGWTLPAGFSPSHQWDLDTKGVRIFRFLGDALSMLGAVIDTALLFEGELTPGISPAAAARNIDFLNKYAGVSMKPRAITEVVVDESQIHSGDFFGIMRQREKQRANSARGPPVWPALGLCICISFNFLAHPFDSIRLVPAGLHCASGLDGMDPMLAWAMGSTTGHVTVSVGCEPRRALSEAATQAGGRAHPINPSVSVARRLPLCHRSPFGSEASCTCASRLQRRHTGP